MSKRIQDQGRRTHGIERGSESAIAWRARRLRAAGFDVALAAELAADWRYELPAILELVENGCAPHLAARILAP